MRGVDVLALGVATAIGASACNAGEPQGAGPTPIPVSAECAAAFEEAVERGTPEQASPEPTVSPPTLPVGALFDLADTVAACRDAEEWMEAYRSHPQDATAGIPAITALRGICQSVPDEEVSGSEMCREVTVGQPPGNAGTPTDGGG